ncbi:MAG: anaerobic ribonucleoside-triphosphate reductase activating protein [bacterium]|nr:anaerobic ribonucleoside-triphosphate reductase activating protein [bacterium]
MKIAAYNPFTLSDYPGKSAAIVFTQGCNFRCTYCHNPALLPSTGSAGVPIEEVLQFLEKRRGKLQGLVISGGEPTLQEGLRAFIESVKEMGYAVKLDTNGSRPGILQEMLTAGLVDYVAMDIKGPPGKYPGVTGVPLQLDWVTRSIRLLIASGIPYEFRTTVVKNQLSPGDLEACGEWIRGAGKYILQPVNNPRPATELTGNKTANKIITYTKEEFSGICTRLDRLGLSCRVR